MAITTSPAATAPAAAPVRPAKPVMRPTDELIPKPLKIAFAVILAVFALIPICYMLLISVTPDSEVSSGHLIPSALMFDNYVKIWHTVALAQGMENSLIISGTASVIAVVLAVGTAYVITRFAFRGRKPFLYSLMGLQAVPHAMLLLPLFVVVSSIQAFVHLRLIGGYPVVIVTYLTFALPFATWLMVSYLHNIPVDLEEAALMDGATRIKALWHVVVPIALPGMVVALVFSFLVGWNDVLFAAILTSPHTQTVAVHLQVFNEAESGGQLPLYGQLMGASVVSSLPVVLLYLGFQRFLVGGLAAGAVKG